MVWLRLTCKKVPHSKVREGIQKDILSSSPPNNPKKRGYFTFENKNIKTIYPKFKTKTTTYTHTCRVHIRVLTKQSSELRLISRFPRIAVYIN